MTSEKPQWGIAGHNGIVVDQRTGEVSVDEYAKKHLRTVSIDLDFDGKYVEFAVSKDSAKELRDYLNTRHALEAKVAELEGKLHAWHEAMTDVSVINWTLNEDNAEDLHKQLIAVIAQNVQEQLDPAVSEQAARVAELEAALRTLSIECGWCDKGGDVTAALIRGHENCPHCDMPLDGAHVAIVLRNDANALDLACALTPSTTAQGVNSEERK